MSKILILSPFSLSTLNHGGKIDLLEIVKLLENSKHSVLIASVDREEFQSEREISGKRANYFKYLVSFSRFPYVAFARQLTNIQQEAIRSFEPEIVLMLTEFMLPAYLQISDLGFKKTILRRQNDEYKYLKSLLSIKKPISSTYRVIELFKMPYLQKKILDANIDLTIDITPIESPFSGRTLVSGPIIKIDKEHDNFVGSKRFDLGYIGNLELANAIDGVEWFVDCVVPLLHSQKPMLRIIIAGKSPSVSLIKKCRKRGIEIVPNPDDVEHMLKDIKVFINPVFKGSGMNMKLVSPIRNRIPIVSTSFGARGYPEIFINYGVADQPREFANLCIQNLLQYEIQANNPTEVASAFHHRMNFLQESILLEFMTE